MKRGQARLRRKSAKSPGGQVQERAARTPDLRADAVISRRPITGISPAQLGMQLGVEGQEISTSSSPMRRAGPAG